MAALGAVLIAGHVVTVNQAGNGDSGPEAISYLHLDALGSVRMVTGPAQNVVSRHHYMPFGTEWESNGDGAVTSLRFAGKERDGETAGGTGSQVQDYFGARYYASQTGRFTTVDPGLDIQAALLNPQRWNRYTM